MLAIIPYEDLDYVGRQAIYLNSGSVNPTVDVLFVNLLG